MSKQKIRKCKTDSIREFGNGAIRDTSNGKLDYYGFRHPLIEQKFAEYMHEHRKMADGSMRDANNWWGGWDTTVSLQSMIRHLEDLQALHAGYDVLEIRRNGSVKKKYIKHKEGVVNMLEDDDVKFITTEDCLNAIRFNSGAYLLKCLDSSLDKK